MSRWLRPSNVLIRFEIFAPSVGFCFGSAGTGSAGKGGHCGSAVERLLTLPALLVVLCLSGVTLPLLSFDAERDLLVVPTLVLVGVTSRSSLVAALERTGVIGVRLTATGLASCTVALRSSSMNSSSSEISEMSPVAAGIVMVPSNWCRFFGDTTGDGSLVRVGVSACGGTVRPLSASAAAEAACVGEVTSWAVGKTVAGSGCAWS